MHAKRCTNPGPGSYEPRPVGRTGDEVAGSSAFKSKTQRQGDTYAREHGDPGAYEPHAASSMATVATRSFNKSLQQGAGKFGNRVPRAEFGSHEQGERDNPGPGSYDTEPPEVPDTKQSSSFASQTKRGASYLTNTKTPGVGEYNPTRPQEDSRVGGDSAFKSKDERFKESMEIGYSAHLGPGTYTVPDDGIGPKAEKNSGKASSTFASMSLRSDMFMGHAC